MKMFALLLLALPLLVHADPNESLPTFRARLLKAVRTGKAGELETLFAAKPRTGVCASEYDEADAHGAASFVYAFELLRDKGRWRLNSVLECGREDAADLPGFKTAVPK